MAHLLFLSHAGADTERALRLAAAIEASLEARDAGLKVWVDKRPDGPHRLHPGRSWQEQLEQAITADSTAFALLLTREGARNWVRLEVQVALDRVIAEQHEGGSYPFIPIKVDETVDFKALPPFAQQYQGVTLGDDLRGLADLIRALTPLDDTQPVRLVEAPFMGLEAFEAKDAALFFGRRKETQDLVDRLRTTNLVLVTGDSGSGKSSLVKAGLIPAFREGALADPLGRRPEPGQWHVVEMRPGTDPFEGLVEGAQRAATAVDIAPEMIFALGTAIRSRDPGAIRDALRQSGPPDASLLLVVDQFEELWTLTLDDTRRRDFLTALLALVPEGDLTRRVVGTMRRDYYHLHTDDERLRDRLAANGNGGRFLLGAMAPESLRDIVEKPLLLAGESEARAAALADEVVKDVAGEPGNLALVEMALHESWARRHESGGDLARAYQRLDRLEGALARAAEEVFWNPTRDPKKLTEPERPIAEALFMRLVRAGDAGGATRRLVAFAELEKPAQTVARKLATPECRRLLVLREPNGEGHGKEAITAELAHEQLVTQWPDYRFWLHGIGSSRHEPDTTRSADKRALDRLMDASANWDSNGRKEDDLARGGALVDFAWPRKARFREIWLSPLERDFVDRSVAAAEVSEKQRQQQVNTLRRLAQTRRVQTWGAVIAAAVFLVVASTAVWQWRNAINAIDYSVEQQRKAEESARSAAAAQSDARAQQLAAEANAQRADAQLVEAKRIDSRRLANLSLQATESGDAVTGILLALRALPNNFDNPDRPIVFELWMPLWAALNAQRELFDLRGHEGPIVLAAFSPDGTRVVTAGDNTARVWRADGKGEPVVLRGHEDSILSAAFSPDGTRVVTGSKDKTARVWRADGKGAPVVLRGHEGPVSSATFSPDGTRVVTGSFDTTARVWNADNSGEPVVLRGHESSLSSATFSPDGIQVITVGNSDKAEIWRADGSGRPVVLRGHEDRIQSAAFSPDGTRVVTAGDNTARVWRADGKGEPVVLRGHEDSILSAAFSPDGTRVVTGSEDKTARVWHADGTGAPVVLRGHEGGVSSATFSPDGTRVVTASKDKTARLWGANGKGETVVLRGDEGSILSAAFSPDGTRVVTASGDMIARVWRADGDGTHIVWSNKDEVTFGSAEISPDSTRIVTIAFNNTASVWRTNGSGEPVVLRGHQNMITSAAFNADGTRIVTTAFDLTARVWRTDGRGEPVVLRSHKPPLYSPAFSPDGNRLVAIATDYTVQVWNADGSGRPVVLRGHEGQVLSATFSPDGTRVVTASGDKTARVWRADGGGAPVVLRGHEGPVLSATFSPDGTRVVTGSFDGTVRVWNADGSGVPVVLRGHEGGVSSATFSPDGTRVVAIGSGNTAEIWHADGSGTPVVFRGHEGGVSSATFSRDGTRVVTASEDKTARVWRADGKGAPVVLRGHEGPVSSAIFSPDGTQVITSSNDGTVRVWPMVGAFEELVKYARSLRLPRQLTDAQKQQYFVVDKW